MLTEQVKDRPPKGGLDLEKTANSFLWAIRSRITVQEWIFRLWQFERSRYDDVVE